MKIALVYDAVYPFIKGGAEKRYFELGKRLSSKNNVHFFGMHCWEGGETITQNNCTYHACGKKRELYNEKGKRKISQAILFSISLFPKLMKHDFDVVDCSSFPYFSIFSAKLACALKGKPLIVTWHEVWGNYWNEYLGSLGIFGKVIEKLASKMPNKIIAVSEKTRNDLIKLGVSPSKISLVPNGIAFDEISSVKPSSSGFDVIFAGRLIKEKNASLLIDAIALAKQSHPNISCGIIGNGPEFSALEKAVKEKGLSKNVSLLGFIESQEKVFSLFKASKIFAFPSIREGFGISVLEANACGLPALVCVHDNNAATDLIHWSENGFITEPSADQLAKAIVSMQKHKWNKTSIQEKARQFDWNAISNQLEKEYGEMYG